MRTPSWKGSSWALCLCVFALSAEAQRGSPGSLLLFPEYDTRPGTGLINLITVTNTDPSTPTGALTTGWRYVDGSDCTDIAV